MFHKLKKNVFESHLLISTVIKHFKEAHYRKKAIQEAELEILRIRLKNAKKLSLEAETNRSYVKSQTKPLIDRKSVKKAWNVGSKGFTKMCEGLSNIADKYPNLTKEP